MKNILYILSTFIILASNCPGGEDGGIAGYSKVSMVNRSEYKIETYWYKTQHIRIPHPDTIFRIDTVAISRNEEVMLYKISSWPIAPPTEGLLSNRPFYSAQSIAEFGYPFDSAVIKYVGRSTQTYLPSQCDSRPNPLCEDSYTIIKDSKVATEYLLTIK